MRPRHWLPRGTPPGSAAGFSSAGEGPPDEIPRRPWVTGIARRARPGRRGPGPARRLRGRHRRRARRVRHAGRDQRDSSWGDIEDGVRAGRFRVRDPELAMVIVAGAALCLGQLLHDHPERDDAAATDQVTEDVLRVLGLAADEAHDICQRPLPDLNGRRP
ncbi:hypothetical protein [Micromonospora chersina]|uniref:hypothetical protein n=1 Tax=Micromonospora chersina TaxID=47854 RepID=UPI003719C89C